MDKTQNPPSSLATSAQSGPAPEIRLVVKIRTFSARWDVKPLTVYRWLARGLPHYNLGERRTRIPLAEGDRWVQQTFYRQRHH